MENFYLTPEAIPILAKLILAIIVTGYLSFAPKSAKAIYWFNGYLIGYTLLDLFAFLGIVFQTDWATLSLPFQYLSSLIFTFCYLQFAYLYKVNLFHKEHRIVTLITAFFGLSGVLFTIYQLFNIGYGDYTIIQYLLPFPLLLITWSAVVLYRKYRTAIRNDSIDPLFIKAYKSFYIITFIAVLISIAPALRALNLISGTAFTIVFFVSNLAVFTLITTAALNYLLEKTTVLVKLVGISLVLFITLIGLQGFLVVPDYQIPEAEEITNTQRKEIHDQVLPYAFFLFGSSAVIILLFPIFYNRSVLMPLRTLLHGLNEVNHGNLGVTITITNQDEFGVVSTHFNEMTKNLRLANTELQNYAEKLEARVKRRTKELNSKTNQLEIQTKELERMEKFRTKLFMDISHELRTPITLISGPLQHLLENTPFDEQSKKQLELAKRNSDRLKKLVEQIIDLNRLESDQMILHLTPVNVTKKLNYFVSSFESLVEHKNIRLTKDIHKIDSSIYLDEDKFEKIITNLISNAIKFTPNNGTIIISLSEVDEEVKITISDNGMGISPEKLPTIFDRYQTSASEHSEYKEGLGVGLAITKEYVELHQGELSVESELGKGTSFFVSFKKHLQILNSDPLNDLNLIEELDLKGLPKRESQEDLDTKIESVASSEAHILIIEDNLDMATYLRDILETQGYQVSEAQNGKEGLAILKTIRPDLIISDIMMPVMDGFEFLKKLRNIGSYQDTPTIFLSARSDIEGKLESLRLGINDYLVKPFITEELICRIENLLRFRHARNQLFLELSEEPEISIDQEFINKLTVAVEQRMSNSAFNIEELASQLSMSRSSFYREIKKATGLSAAAFVREIRLQKARQKLENNIIKSIPELASEIGFSTPSYFSKVYENRFGKKPSDYLS